MLARLLAGALVAVGCGSSSPAKVKVTDNTSTGLNAGPTQGLVDENTGAPALGACVTETTGAEQRQVALYMMLDSSGSMLDQTGTFSTKWDSVSRAIRGFLSETRDSDLEIGLQFFPLAKPGSQFTCRQESDCGPNGGPCFLKTCSQGNQLSVCVSDADCAGARTGNSCVLFGLCSNSDPNAPVACPLQGNARCSNGLGSCQDFERPCTNATQCDQASYATPAVEIGPVSQTLTQIDQALTKQTPQGQTPTPPALQGALDHARAWAQAHPDQTVATLLATDGLPTQCGKNNTTNGVQLLDEVVGIAASGLTGAVPVRTFVIGVFQPGDGTSLNNVNAIAKAGGTDKAFSIDTSGDVNQQFLDALRTIRGGQLACQFQIPKSSSQLDYFKVNLKFNDGASAQQLSFVNDQTGCAANPSGWHYDVDPNQGTPSSIQVCPAVCDQFKAATSGSIQLQLGCATIIR